MVLSWNGIEWKQLTKYALPSESALHDIVFAGETVWMVGAQNDTALIMQSTGCATIPNTPQLTAPANHATAKKNPVTLKWQVTADTLYSEIDLWRVRQKDQWRPWQVNGNRAKKELRPGKTYRWRVRNCNTAGCSAWSEKHTFSIAPQ